MEYLDVLDNEGNKTGNKKDITAIYRDGDHHKSVHVWIINENKEILLQKRNPNKKTFPNLWAISVAGHVRSYETSRQAAYREVKEELGYKVSEEDFVFLFTIKRNQKHDDNILNVFDDVYLLNLDVDVNKSKLEIEELTDIKYVYYEYLEEIYRSGDNTYVPYDEEHKKLFKYLNNKFKNND